MLIKLLKFLDNLKAFFISRIFFISSYLHKPVIIFLKKDYDVAILNGIVINPASDTEEVLNIGIRNGKIVAINRQDINASIKIDAKEKHVVPGFIDLCSYGPQYYGDFFKAADGITTNLNLHGGTVFAREWYLKRRIAYPLTNYGTTASHSFIRKAVGVKDRYKETTHGELDKIIRISEENLKLGALGISFAIEYNPGASYKEIKSLMCLAKKFEAPCFFHLRYSSPFYGGTNKESVDEVINLAKETGVTCHIHHIASTGGMFTMQDTILQIENARKQGLNITANMYPYNFWATFIDSARFDEGWQDKFKISYDSLQVAGTNIRLDSETFKKYRKKHKTVAAYSIPDSDIIDSLKTPWIFVSSDGFIDRSKNCHPRGSGCFSRTIGKFVRDEKILSLKEAIKKMSYLPAKLLEDLSPQMKQKGRLQEGADADIVIFDYEKIIDKATIEKPAQFSAGINYVLINGSIVRKYNRMCYKPVGKLISSKHAMLSKAQKI